MNQHISEESDAPGTNSRLKYGTILQKSQRRGSIRRSLALVPGLRAQLGCCTCADLASPGARRACLVARWRCVPSHRAPGPRGPLIPGGPDPEALGRNPGTLAPPAAAAPADGGGRPGGSGLVSCSSSETKKLGFCLKRPQQVSFPFSDRDPFPRGGRGRRGRSRPGCRGAGSTSRPSSRAQESLDRKSGGWRLGLRGPLGLTGPDGLRVAPLPRRLHSCRGRPFPPGGAVPSPSCWKLFQTFSHGKVQAYAEAVRVT